MWRNGRESAKSKGSLSLPQRPSPYWLSSPGLLRSLEGCYGTVREWFLSLGCVSGKFGAAASKSSPDAGGISLALIENAMLLGACRKYGSWLQGKALKPIQSIRYFEALIAEIQKEPLPLGYSGYLRKKIRQLNAMWNEFVKSRPLSQKQ